MKRELRDRCGQRKVAVRLSSHREVVDTIEGSNKLTGIEAEACRTDAVIEMCRQWKAGGSSRKWKRGCEVMSW